MHCHGYGFDTVITVSRTVTQNSNVRGKITVLLQLLSVITRVIVVTLSVNGNDKVMVRST